MLPTALGHMLLQAGDCASQAHEHFRGRRPVASAPLALLLAFVTLMWGSLGLGTSVLRILKFFG